MDQVRARQLAEPTSLSGGYRHGYDPEEVDRYVTGQQRRIGTAEVRAVEAERKLAAAVGQLREMQRRVAQLEDVGRPVESTRVDSVGEHVQRIFEEARQAADAIRSSTESAMSRFRERTIDEARSILAGAQRKAEEIETEATRRRREHLAQLEDERSKATAHLTLLQQQQKSTLSELLRLREAIDSTVSQVSSQVSSEVRARGGEARRHKSESAPRQTVSTFGRNRDLDPSLDRFHTRPKPQPVFEPVSDESEDPADSSVNTARLVREHRERVSSRTGMRRLRFAPESTGPSATGMSVFDYEAQ